MRLSTQEFLDDPKAAIDAAARELVTITQDGRDKLVVVPAEEYELLRAGRRRVRLSHELTDAELDLIAKAEVPAEYAHLDDLLEGWKP